MVVVRDGTQVGLPGADLMSAMVGLPGRSFGLLSLLLPGPPPALGIALDDLGGGGQALANLRPLERGVVERVHEENVGEHVVEVELLPDHRIRSSLGDAGARGAAGRVCGVSAGAMISFSARSGWDTPSLQAGFGGGRNARSGPR